MGPRPANAGLIWRLINGFGAYWVVVAAIELGIFEFLAETSVGVEVLASALACEERHLRTLCDVLVGLGLLDLAEDRYSLTAESDAFLVRDRSGSMRDLVVHSPGPWINWSSLATIARGSAPPEIVGESFYRQLVRATFPTQYAVATRLAADDIGPVTSILDVGAGSGSWSIALLKAFPTATAVLNDMPGVLTIAMDMAVAHHVADRCRPLPGDYFAVSVLDDGYDIVVLAHILRAEGTEGAAFLISLAADALRPGGMVVVADYFVDDDHRGPLNALLLGATMMAATPNGATFARSDLRAWLIDAGFVDVELRQPYPFQDVMLARKPAASRMRNEPVEGVEP